MKEKKLYKLKLQKYLGDVLVIVILYNLICPMFNFMNSYIHIVYI